MAKSDTTRMSSNAMMTAKKNYQCLIPILWSGAKKYIKKSVENGYPSYLD